MTAPLPMDTIGRTRCSRKEYPHNGGGNAVRSVPGRSLEYPQMDVQTSWQAFACTGSILRYLDYKQAQTPDEPPAGDTDHGDFCDTGSGAERDPL